MIEIILAILLGGFFGYVLNVVRASSPAVLRKMLQLKALELMKIILFAIGMASALVAVTAWLGLLNVSHFHVKMMNLGVIVGGVIFGVGFGLGGTCPGTCVAASAGTGLKRALLAVLGGICGAGTFSLCYGWIKKTGIFTQFAWGKITLFKISKNYNYLLPGGYAGLLIVGLLFMALAYYLPDRFR